MLALDLTGENWVVQSGSFVACEPGVRMDFGVAMGVRQGEKAWRSLVQQGLDQNREEIAQILRQYNIPMVDDKGEPIR